jgi:CheY-like chemotaxis protein
LGCFHVRSILIVEDDPEDEDFMVEEIKAHFKIKPEVIRTGKEFVAALDRMASNLPDVIVLDIMLRWAFPWPELRASEAPGSFHVAGIRCLRQLRSRESTRSIPIILYSALDQDDFMDQVILTKSDNIEPLLRAIEGKVTRDYPRQLDK